MNIETRNMTPDEVAAMKQKRTGTFIVQDTTTGEYREVPAAEYEGDRS
jgi:hypothetical protein